MRHVDINVYIEFTGVVPVATVVSWEVAMGLGVVELETADH